MFYILPQISVSRNTACLKNTSSHLSQKRPIQQRLKQMLRLALGFALLGAQALEFASDVSEFLLAR
jgi:hypothetical protein